MSERGSATAPAVRPAGTLVLLHEQQNGRLEVLLQQRGEGLVFGGVWAFPGGVVEEQDGPTGEPGSAVWVDAGRKAAMRETCEETGIDLRAGDGPAPIAWSRWITPAAQKRRFDTLFFAAAAPREAALRFDPSETLALEWAEVRRVIDELRGGKRRVMTPTLLTLLDLEASYARHGDLATLLRGESARRIVPLTPRLFRDAGGEYALLPWHPQHPEATAGATWPDYLRVLPDRVPLYR